MKSNKELERLIGEWRVYWRFDSVLSLRSLEQSVGRLFGDEDLKYFITETLAWAKDNQDVEVKA